MRKQPRAGQTVWDGKGCAVRLITCKRKGKFFVCDTWREGVRETLHLFLNGKIVRPAAGGFIGSPLDALSVGLLGWHHNRKKAKRSGPLMRSIRSINRQFQKIHVVTAQARRDDELDRIGNFANGTQFPDWYGVPSGSLSCKACAVVDATVMVHVPVRVIEDPNNPENNGREVSMLMPKSRIDAIKKLTEGTK
jgi:hypothetical protein